MKIGEWYFEDNHLQTSAMKVVNIISEENMIDIEFYLTGHWLDFSKEILLNEFIGGVKNGRYMLMTEKEVAKYFLIRGDI